MRHLAQQQALPLPFSISLMYSFPFFVSIRQGAATVLDKQFPDGQRDQRVEFIPVEWRSSLKLDEGN